MTEEERQAEALRALLDGEAGEAVDPEDAEAVGLLRHAAGAAAPDPWDRIRSATSPPVRRSWRRRAALASVAMAACLALAVWWGSGPSDLPPGPSDSELEAAAAALDPASGSAEQRLSAFRVVAARERQRLVAELQR